MGSYIKLSGEARMRPRPGDLIVFPPERRRAKNAVRVSGRTLREKYGITLTDCTMSFQASSPVSARHIVNGPFHGQTDVPFCVVVNRVLKHDVQRIAARANSFGPAVPVYPAGAFAVTCYYVAYPRNVDDAGDSCAMNSLFANVMASANLGQASMASCAHRVPRSPLAGHAEDGPSPVHDDDVKELLDKLDRMNNLSGVGWTDKIVRDIAGQTRLGDLLHAASVQWLDQTTRFPQLHQFTVPLELMKNESVCVYRLADSGLAAAVLDTALMRLSGQTADICDDIAELLDVLKTAKDALVAYGRKVVDARRPSPTIAEAVAALADDISKLAGATMPAPNRPVDVPTPAQSAADVLRAIAGERRMT